MSVFLVWELFVSQQQPASEFLLLWNAWVSHFTHAVTIRHCHVTWEDGTVSYVNYCAPHRTDRLDRAIITGRPDSPLVRRGRVCVVRSARVISELLKTVLDFFINFMIVKIFAKSNTMRAFNQKCFHIRAIKVSACSTVYSLHRAVARTFSRNSLPRRYFPLFFVFWWMETPLSVWVLMNLVYHSFPWLCESVKTISDESFHLSFMKIF